MGCAGRPGVESRGGCANVYKVAEVKSAGLAALVLAALVTQRSVDARAIDATRMLPNQRPGFFDPA